MEKGFFFLSVTFGFYFDEPYMYTGYPVKCSSVFGSDTRLLDSHIPLLCYSKTVIDIRFFLTQRQICSRVGPH